MPVFARQAPIERVIGRVGRLGREHDVAVLLQVRGRERGVVEILDEARRPGNEVFVHVDVQMQSTREGEGVIYLEARKFCPPTNLPWPDGLYSGSADWEGCDGSAEEAVCRMRMLSNIRNIQSQLCWLGK